MRLQRAFRWRTLQQAIYKEVMRRITKQREIRQKVLESVAAEQTEFNILKEANERMKQSLHEQNEQIIRLSAEKREAIAGIDQDKKIMIDDLYAEIARLRQAVQLLN